MSRVFIIILHYHNVKDTEECLISLQKLNYDNFEIVVVDNDPNNKSAHELRSFVKNLKPKPSVLISTENNLGFAGGNNVGIKYAMDQDADYILLLNNDTIIEPNFLKELIRAGENDEKNGILGPIIYHYKSNEVWFAGGKINRLYTKAKHIRNTKYEIRDTDYITGCCMLIKREVIDKIGLMPEEYFLYYEDVDWCLKVRKAGFNCIVVPESKIWHKVSQSTSEGSFSYIYYHFRNGLLLCKRNAPFFIKILAYLSSFLIYIKQIIKSPNKWTKAIKLGIKDFYRRRFGNYENWH